MASSQKSRLASWSRLIIRIVLGGVFIFASAHKVIDPSGFAEAIANYQILPGAFVNPAALLLPWIELVCGICLVFGVLVRGSALILTGLLLIFIAALGFSIFRGLDISCGCFSNNSSQTGNMYLDIAKDTVFFLMSLWILFGPTRTKSIPITPYGSKKG